MERRDAENVVLMRDERYRAMDGALGLAARSLGLVAKANRQLAEDVFAEELPWLAWLRARNRRRGENVVTKPGTGHPGVTDRGKGGGRRSR